MEHPLDPSPQLLTKLASIAVHADELLSPTGHQFDHAALLALVHDAQVKEWLRQMDSMALIPKKR